MTTPSIVSPENQNVTFVELFFDLVFVFSVTQVVAVLHDGITPETVGRAVLLFWLVWWAWTQFTWALNAANTTHSWVELGTLFATGVAFFMAVSLPEAFLGRGLWFAVSYVLVRSIGLAIYRRVAQAAGPDQHAAVRRFWMVSSGGLLAVLIGGYLGGQAQYAFWGITILLDVAAAAVAGKLEGWNLHAPHFVERHALFVIIALGECLIVTAGGVTGGGWSTELIVLAPLAVAVTCALWWSYFTRAKPALEHALEASRGAARSTMARDAFSLIHFPMLCGVIAYGAGVAEAIAHPSEPLSVAWRSTLALGLVLFVGGMALAVRRATGHLLGARTALVLLTAFAIVATKVSPLFSLLIALAGVTAACVVEQRAQVPFEVETRAHVAG